MLIEKNITTLLVLSFLVILWWRAVWSLLDVLFFRLAKGRKGLLLTFDIASILFVVAVLFLHPEFRETFH